MTFSPEELSRYNRHFKLKGFGPEKQAHLKQARILLVGAGGLGCPSGLYLAAAGIGHIGVIDDDGIELSNLQRQIAHRAEDLGKNKAESLVDRMRELNPHVGFSVYKTRLTEKNAAEIMDGYGLVLDGSDNFPTRYLVADACYLMKKTLVYGAVQQFEGQVALFGGGQSPCYRCLFPRPPEPGAAPSCSEAGVLGVLPGTIGLMMASEAIKYAARFGNTLLGKLFIYNAMTLTTKHFSLAADPDCALCGEHPTILSLKMIEQVCEVAVPLPPQLELSPHECQRVAGQGARLIDIREAHEWRRGIIPGAECCSVADVAGFLSREGSAGPPVLLYCESGGRSGRLLAQIQDLPVAARLFHLKGGLQAWIKFGFPLTLSAKG